ncbi:hypothetical protein LTR05_008109 [Lithohypha guttulata]|uniref:HIRA-interacting protein 3 n=1 Tax=Lithohypha guttulata TaxID=1690604 RepID=A0AAN7Y3W2_9EURO|nr:hypothetical protein LTR05_008109 [Lithohypha guttulata]
MPTDKEIETSLRDAVRAWYKNPTDDPPTVNIIRAAARDELELDEDFFKDDKWKSRSKNIVQDQFEQSSAQQDEQKQEQKAEGKEQKQVLKRSSESADIRPRKKSRLSSIQQEDEEEESTALSEPPESDEELSEEEDVKPKKKTQKKSSISSAKVSKPKPPKQTQARAKKKQASPESSDALSPAEDPEKEVQPRKKATNDDDTSSELSSVIDEPAAPKRKSKAKNGEGKAAAKSTKPSKSKSTAEPDPNAEEIKRLQGWLVKCGVRKVWGKELKPYETPKAKISHLKEMLSDVGMTGRFSNEKAAQIKEARELAADIEAVQEGNERWGKASDDEDDATDDRPKRRVVRGAQNYAFLSSDGEETD